MRKLAFIPLAAVAFAACSDQTSAPLAPEDAAFGKAVTYFTDGKLMARMAGVTGNIKFSESSPMQETFTGAGFGSGTEILQVLYGPGSWCARSDFPNEVDSFTGNPISLSSVRAASNGRVNYSGTEAWVPQMGSRAIALYRASDNELMACGNLRTNGGQQNK
jgi:hypothetical protein